MNLQNGFFKKLQLFFIVILCSINFAEAWLVAIPRAYYISTSGNDNNTGDKNNPFQSIDKINRLKLHAGDSILFKGGETFDGTLKINGYRPGIANKPVFISSFGKQVATINGGNNEGILIDSAEYINIIDLVIKGAGRKNGNTHNGVSLNNCNHISINRLAITGFQKAGLFIYSSFKINVNHVHAYENGFAGISIDGTYQQRNSKQITIRYCLADNNPGDPSNLNNHSGNGIIAGNCSDIIIEYCIATNNGWDMPRIGNGPVGIWCYEADNVIIRYCISYRNKTSTGGDDGGGFDLDGGVTNSLIGYCLSYENQGCAFGIFQYAGASAWNNNIIRNNISSNDGTTSAAHASAYIWNSSGDKEQFSNLSFYNNIVYNIKGACIHYASDQDKRKSFVFYNNIFVAKDEIINGDISLDTFSGNTWWSLMSRFNIDGIKNFKLWAIKSGKEQTNGKITGSNFYPLKNVNYTRLNNPHKLKSIIRNELIKLKMYKSKVM